MKRGLALLALAFMLASCSNSSSKGTGKAAQSDTKSDPCEGLLQLDPHCGWKPHWDDTGISINAIDGTKKESLLLDSKDADGLDAGRLHYANLRICFENGKLCRKSLGIYVAVHGMVSPNSYASGYQTSYASNYQTSIRLKFDDEKPVSQTWGIADSHDAFFPYGREKQFLTQLLQHNKLILEFSYYEKAPRTLTFDLSGQAEKMKSIGISSY